MKANSFREVKRFQDIPNIGPAMVKSLGLLGLCIPTDLIDKDPLVLYQKLGELTGCRQDPCVLDTFIAAIDFMNGAPARPWFFYTKNRKKDYPDI